MGFLLSPAFWPIGFLAFLILFWLLLSWFGRNRTGKQVAREMLLRDTPGAIADDAEEVREAAARVLAEADNEAEQAQYVADKLRKTLGVPKA